MIKSDRMTDLEMIEERAKQIHVLSHELTGHIENFTTSSKREQQQFYLPTGSYARDVLNVARQNIDGAAENMIRTVTEIKLAEERDAQYRNSQNGSR